MRSFEAEKEENFRIDRGGLRVYGARMPPFVLRIRRAKYRREEERALETPGNFLPILIPGPLVGSSA